MNTEFLDSPTQPSIRLTRTYDHPVDRVWRAITTSDNLKHWIPCDVEIELEPDGVVRFGFGGGGRVRAIEPPHRLVFTWEDDVLDFQLVSSAVGTVFTLTHHFGDRAGAASFATGWEQCFAALEAVLADREPDSATADRCDERHEELVTRFGLDQPQVTYADDGWRVRFERQLICSAEVAWKLFFGGADAPAVGEQFRAFAAPDVVLGTVTEIDPPRSFSFSTGVDEPGEDVQLTLGEGTGHGARLVLEVAGTDPADIDAAIDQWGGGALAHIVREAARLLQVG
ncbi:SRPBCC domain-containing protein [Antrihabitans sp. NCIMB 15449]|uniref:SRPBCC domain-containing protein n=1 Tax=Antrihabitans spumae TaxID=3373370 RepID=A0ABW7JU34_9NOCA